MKKFEDIGNFVELDTKIDWACNRGIYMSNGWNRRELDPPMFIEARIIEFGNVFVCQQDRGLPTRKQRGITVGEFLFYADEYDLCRKKKRVLLKKVSWDRISFGEDGTLIIERDPVYV